MSNKMNVKVGPLTGEELYALSEIRSMLKLNDSEVLRYCMAVTFRAIVEGINNAKQNEDVANAAASADEQPGTGVSDAATTTDTGTES